jgi:hypothetical protein
MKSNALITRLVNLLRKPVTERNEVILKKIKSLSTLPFYLGKSSVNNIFLGYHPDSYNFFDEHTEFEYLFKRFSMFNKMNNGGDIARLWSFILNIKQVLAENIEGDFAELGVWRGNTASVLAYYALKANRKVFLFDTYEGFNKKDFNGVDSEKEMAFDDTSLKMVMEVIGNESEVCEFVKGYFPETITENYKARKYSVVSLDCDLYDPMKAGLKFFYPLMTSGAIFLLHDYSSLFWTGSKKAIDEFCKENNEHVILMPDKSGSAFIRKSNNSLYSS